MYLPWGKILSAGLPYQQLHCEEGRPVIKHPFFLFVAGWRWMRYSPHLCIHHHHSYMYCYLWRGFPNEIFFSPCWIPVTFFSPGFWSTATKYNMMGEFTEAEINPVHALRSVTYQRPLANSNSQRWRWKSLLDATRSLCALELVIRIKYSCHPQSLNHSDDSGTEYKLC